MSCQTVMLLQLPVTNIWLYSFIFFATMLSYTGHFWLASKKSESSHQLQWYRKHQSITLLLMSVSFTALTISFLFIVNIWPFLVIAAVLNLFYTGPLLFKKSLRLPKIFTYLKSYVIGFVWAYVSVVLPIAFYEQAITVSVFLLFLNHFMLVSLLVLIFDYRDKLPDYEFGIHTPANAMNEREFGTFFLFNTLIYAGLVAALSFVLKQPLFLLQLLLVPVMILLQQQSKKQQSDLFYLFRVDGVMILSLLLSLFMLI
jgi:4-hydroxybenzoate polyprenyltransferase